MASSIRAGMEHIDPDIDWIAIALADMPSIKQNTLSRLFDRVNNSYHGETHSLPIAPAMTESGRPGHPVFWPRWMFGLLKSLSGDTGGRLLLDEGVARMIVEDPGIYKDIDTPDQL